MEREWLCSFFKTLLEALIGKFGTMPKSANKRCRKYSLGTFYEKSPIFGWQLKYTSKVYFIVFALEKVIDNF